MSGILLKNIKIAIIGDARVGKTTLRRNYMGERLEGSYLATIGADFSSYKLETKINDQYWLAKLQIWDLAGQTDYETMRSQFLKGTDIVMVVYDLTNKESFDNVWQWLKESFVILEPSEVAISHIGNKYDLANQIVIDNSEIAEQVGQIEETIKPLSVDAYKTSALTGRNVREAFMSGIAALITSD